MDNETLQSLTAFNNKLIELKHKVFELEKKLDAYIQTDRTKAFKEKIETSQVNNLFCTLKTPIEIAAMFDSIPEENYQKISPSTLVTLARSLTKTCVNVFMLADRTQRFLEERNELTKDELADIVYKNYDSVLPRMIKMFQQPQK